MRTHIFDMRLSAAVRRLQSCKPSIRSAPQASLRPLQAAMEKVRTDKLREVKDGHDGTWIAHPALLPIAMEVG